MRFLLFAALFFALFISNASAKESDNVIAYARALRDFNPGLSREESRQFAQRVLVEADRAGLDARLVVALIAVESRWHPSAVSRAGAQGLGQLMPATAGRLGVDPLDAAENLHGTVAHLAYLVRTYDHVERRRQFALALGAYNAGEGAVARYQGVPPYSETQHYVHDVVLLWRRLAGF